MVKAEFKKECLPQWIQALDSFMNLIDLQGAIIPVPGQMGKGKIVKFNPPNKSRPYGSVTLKPVGEYEKRQETMCLVRVHDFLKKHSELLTISHTHETIEKVKTEVKDMVSVYDAIAGKLGEQLIKASTGLKQDENIAKIVSDWQSWECYEDSQSLVESWEGFYNSNYFYPIWEVGQVVSFFNGCIGTVEKVEVTKSVYYPYLGTTHVLIRPWQKHQQGNYLLPALDQEFVILEPHHIDGLGTLPELDYIQMSVFDAPIAEVLTICHTHHKIEKVKNTNEGKGFMKLVDIYTGMKEQNSFLCKVENEVKECIIIDVYATAKGYFNVQECVSKKVHANIHQRSIKSVCSFNMNVKYYFDKYQSTFINDWGIKDAIATVEETVQDPYYMPAEVKTGVSAFGFEFSYTHTPKQHEHERFNYQALYGHYGQPLLVLHPELMPDFIRTTPDDVTCAIAPVDTIVGKQYKSEDGTIWSVESDKPGFVRIVSQYSGPFRKGGYSKVHEIATVQDWVKKGWFEPVAIALVDDVPDMLYKNGWRQDREDYTPEEWAAMVAQDKAEKQANLKEFWAERLDRCSPEVKETLNKIFTPKAYEVIKVADYSNSQYLVDTSAQDAKDYARDKALGLID